MTNSPRVARPAKVETSRLMSVDALRGLAALVVCLYHLMARPESPLSPVFGTTPIGTHGWLGVQAFFVISGFVVPLAMFRNGYRLADAARFMLKRIVRLDPPFLVSIAIVIVLNAVLPGTIDSPVPPALTPPILFGHVFYGFSHLFLAFDWLNSVYWTLEIEFQYYLLVALMLPLLVSTRTWVSMLAMGALVALAFVRQPVFEVFHWGAVFGVGLLLFLQTAGVWSRRASMAAWPMVVLASWLTTGLAVTAVAVGTALAITWWRTPGSLLRELGRLSFSLYLVHIPIGGRIMVEAGRRGVGGAWLLVVLVLAVMTSLAAAYLLWRFVERPAQTLAQRIGYLGQRSVAAPSICAPRAA